MELVRRSLKKVLVRTTTYDDERHFHRHRRIAVIARSLIFWSVNFFLTKTCLLCCSSVGRGPSHHLDLKTENSFDGSAQKKNNSFFVGHSNKKIFYCLKARKPIQ